MRKLNYVWTFSIFLAAACGSVENIESETETETDEAGLTPIGNQQYINAVYARLLGRAADAGAQGWVNLLNAGFRRLDVVNAIIVTPEGQGRIAALTAQADPVEAAYRTILARNSDPGGKQALTNVFQTHGMGVVAAIMLTSQEFLLTMVPEFQQCPGLLQAIQECLAFVGAGPDAAIFCGALINNYNQICTGS